MIQKVFCLANDGIEAAKFFGGNLIYIGRHHLAAVTPWFGLPKYKHEASEIKKSAATKIQ